MITKKLIKYNFSKGNAPKYIVIHDTGNKNKGADAEAHYKYFNGGNRNASAHYFVDDHETIQTVEHSNAAWHCGDGKGNYGITNYNSIGIEICINSDGDYDKAVQKTIELVRTLMKELNIPIEKVVRHYDASRKKCPGTMSSNNWEKWTWFINQIKQSSDESEQLTLIMGTTQATVEQMVSYALKGNPNPKLPNCTIEELAQLFIEEAEVEGIRGDGAWAQTLKETGYFKYGGIVLPEQNNYSGIGALNNNAQGDAARFESPRIGVRAQMQHLKAYGSTENLKLVCVDPRFHLVKRGASKYFEWLGYKDNPNGAGWAWSGSGYGYSIIKILNEILKEPKDEPKEDNSNIPQWQSDGLKKLVDNGVIDTPEYWKGKLGEQPTLGEVMGILANMI